MARLTTLQAHFFSLRPIDGAGFHQPDRYSPRTGLALLPGGSYLVPAEIRIAAGRG
jgi:hypothetical protein